MVKQHTETEVTSQHCFFGYEQYLGLVRLHYFKTLGQANCELKKKAH